MRQGPYDKRNREGGHMPTLLTGGQGINEAVALAERATGEISELKATLDADVRAVEANERLTAEGKGQAIAQLRRQAIDRAAPLVRTSLSQLTSAQMAAGHALPDPATARVALAPLNAAKEHLRTAFHDLDDA